MAFKLMISWSGAERDYTRYLIHQSLSISESLNVPTTCTFSLSPIDSMFVIPPEHAYIDLYGTLKNKSLFTGFITVQPKMVYMALSPTPIMGGQLFEYQINCSSDEHLLNIKSVPFIPAYLNQYQGDILASIAEVLCPGFFDTTMLQKGDIVPYFEYKPTQSWSELAKEWGDATRFRNRGRNKKLVYAPYDDAPLGIGYDERKAQRTFDPKGLNTDVMTVPLVNDVTIIGRAEAGNNREDYFIGDGFTGTFPLHHKTFEGASALLLNEPWTNTDLNKQNWYLLDPYMEFDFTAGALNIVTPAPPHKLGDSYLQMNNGLEVAGSIDLEHGEITFNGHCEGIIGGLYGSFDENTQDKLIAGFVISTTDKLTPPAIIPLPGGGGMQGIGYGGIQIAAFAVQQPTAKDAEQIGDVIITKPNHNYVLQTLITAPMYTRYNQVYRTQDGTEFGGTVDSVPCSITFAVQDWDILAVKVGTDFFYEPTITKIASLDIELPAFLAYALINNQQLNLTLGNTVVAAMPQGSLFALCGPSGLARPTGWLPMLPWTSGWVKKGDMWATGFIGPVLPWPSPASGNIVPGPLMLSDTAVQEVLGNGLELQVAQITPGNESDTLGFYNQNPLTIPAAGTPLRFQSWESQAAIARIQNKDSIDSEADIVGDDGIRSAVVSDLTPLPRTSEDCDNAALAYLHDRGMVLYKGTYTCTSFFFTGDDKDWQYFPTCGRELFIHAPKRKIDQQNYLVTTLKISILDLQTELLSYEIGFGADLYLEKMLKNFIMPDPATVLTFKDKADPPDPRYTTQVGNSYLPDLNNVQISLFQIVDDRCRVEVFDTWLTDPDNPWDGAIEIRRQDHNWGNKDLPDYVDLVSPPITESDGIYSLEFDLLRRQYDQTWYLRPVKDGIYSRRSKVLRLMWPMKPDQPLYIGATAIREQPSQEMGMIDSYNVQYGFNGDVRNIWGVEIRGADNRTILVQKQCTAAASDLLIDLAQTPMPFMPAPYNTDFEIYAYFFNQAWIYSDGLPIDVRRMATLDMPLIWSPGYANIGPGDTFDMWGNFGIKPFYKMTEDGTPIVSFTMIGNPAPNQVSKIVGEPVLLIATATDAGASIPPGKYAVAVCAWDGVVPSDPSVHPSFKESPMSNVIYVDVAQGQAIDITIDPPDLATAQEVFISATNNNQIWFWVAKIGATDTSYRITSVPHWNVGAPDDEFDHFRVQNKIEWHAGILGAQVHGVIWNKLQIGMTNVNGEDYHFIPGSLVGRSISMLAKYDPDVEIPIVNYKIIDNDEEWIQVGPNTYNQIPPDLTTIFAENDVITIRCRPEQITSNSYVDPLWINPFSANKDANGNYVLDDNGNKIYGLRPHEETGRLCWIIDGPGRGQVRAIADNTDTKITLSSDWDPANMPTADSVIVVVDAQWRPTYDTQQYEVADRFSYGPIVDQNFGTFGPVAQPDVQNLGGITWILRLLTISADGRYNDTDDRIPMREAYAFPAFGTSQNDMGTISWDTGGADLTPQGRRVFRRGTRMRVINGVFVKSTM